MIQDARIRPLKDSEVNSDGDFVLYWMQAAQRVAYNHALERAARRANELEKPLLVLFNLVKSYPGAIARPYRFMLEGLQETARDLDKRGAAFIVTLGEPDKQIPKVAKKAALVVTDRAYTRVQRKWREDVAEGLDILFEEVETNIIVPVKEASPKEEYAAYTIRPKIRKKLERFMTPLKPVELKSQKPRLNYKTIDISNIDAVLKKLKPGKGPGGSDFRGGYSRAGELLEEFISEKLSDYDDGRNDPNRDCLSHMSPYLHFGQISPLEIALRVRSASGNGGKDAYLEELIIRRELAHNFVHYNDQYDKIESLPDWARETLAEHSGDKREYVYDCDDFEKAETHDPYWNAAQKQMVLTGKMHGYMRMYWGKKILEWSESPGEAWATALYLNDKYELDGRDPNGYANVAWCFGKHDRPWQERPVFGKTRYMNANGLRRKFDADAWVEKIAALEEERG